MKKSLVAICALMLCFIIIAGCTPTKPVNNVVSTADETATQGTTSADESTMATTVPATTVPATTVPATTVAETVPDDTIYTPAGNKVSSDTTRPSYRPQGTGDEAPVLDGNYKYIAFTFDDGPHYDLTYKIVNKLAEYGGVGTFFVVGNRVYGTQRNAMKYAYDCGNEIGVHAWTHENYYHSCSDTTFRTELDKTANKIYEVTGEYPLLMRPTGGSITSARVKSSGFAVINWNVDSIDWRYSSRSQSNVNIIANNILRSADEGDIILMHDLYYNTYDAFCIAIDDLYNRGYRFVTVSQLLGLDSSDVGKLYYSAY
ncbi:MAG: polysaccharide deacetylase family protein [Ruminococcus sp.]|nr:polysaccharide deacetylase family protein [Ruminococcus sp.]